MPHSISMATATLISPTWANSVSASSPCCRKGQIPPLPHPLPETGRGDNSFSPFPLWEGGRGVRSAQRTLPYRGPGRVEDVRRGEAVAEGREVAEGPDDFLVAGHFEELRILRAGVAIADDHIAIGQHVQRRDPGEYDPRQFALL